MKHIFTLFLIGISSLLWGQNAMKAPSKVVTINNSGNPIKPIQTSNKRAITQEKIKIKKADFKKYPKQKRKAILKEPEKYVIIE